MDWSAHDLREILTLGLERGRSLLTAGELSVLAGALALPDAPLGSYARLTGRVSAAQRAHAVDHAEALVDAGLIDGLVPWSVRAEHATVAELTEGLRALGLPARGKRPELVARLRDRVGWSPQRWWRVRHRGLIRRLERFALLRSHPDRAVAVVERLGHVLWPCYPLTGGAPLFVDRRALLAWEALADAPDTTPPEALLAGLTRGHAAGPAGLDRERPLARRILELAEGLERGDAPRARALYDGVAARVPRYAARAGLRAALLSEREGHPAEALQRLATLRPLASGPDRLAVNRSGRRLARELRRGWAPDPPAPPIRERSVALPPAERVGARPLWAAGLTVEAAVAEVVARAGRSALRAEGGPWIALFTSIFAGDTWFLPVDGVLPVPRLSGPLDVGTPAFAVRRPEAVGRVMHAVQAGRAPDLVRATQSRFGGRRLAGLRGPCPSDEVMPALAEALGPALLCAVFGPLLARGWSAASGLPDLLVLPGPPVVLPDVVASRLDGSARLVEVKGPGDTLSDRQRHWLAELAPLGVVEVWNVRPISATGVGPGTPSQPPSSTRTPPAP